MGADNDKTTMEVLRSLIRSKTQLVTGLLAFFVLINVVPWDGVASFGSARPKSNGNFLYRPNADSKLEPAQCPDLLLKHLSGAIAQTSQPSAAYPIEKAYVTRSQTEHPFYVSVHDGSIDGLRTAIFHQGVYYENIMTKVIGQIISEAAASDPKRSPIFLDVGGNVGWFSLLAASHGAEVFAFEPNVINMIRFCESQMLNGWTSASPAYFEGYNRIHSYMKGVGNVHGQALKMYAPDPKNPGSFTFNSEMAHTNQQQLDGGELPIVTLDALAKDQGWIPKKRTSPAIALMKMDIEGLEHVALAGAKELLRANIIQNVLIEFNKDLSKDHWVEMTSTFFECGYKLYMVGDHRGPDQLFERTASLDPRVVVEDVVGKLPKENLNAWFKIETTV